jgi:uncharacterized protein (TIGR03437 family)
VTPQLINFQCPNLKPGNPITIVVQSDSSPSLQPIQAVMAEATPGIFQLPGGNQGAILVAGTNLIAMPTVDGMPSRPAKIGEYLAIYADGLGPVNEVIALGTPAPLDHTVATEDQVTVVIGDIELPAAFAGLAPGLAGLYQVNVALTDQIARGDAVPVYLKVTHSDGTVFLSNSVTVAIQSATP